MLMLEDGFTKRLVLEFLIQKLEDGDANAMHDNGVTAELVAILRQRSVRDLIQVAEMKQTEIRIECDLPSIINCFRRLDVIKRNQQRQTYFVLHGATPDMMASLFKLSQFETRALRERLCPEQRAPGRRPGPTLEERQDIWQAWLELSRTQQDLRERYYLLHQRFNHLALSTLWVAVHEVERETRRVRSPQSNPTLSRSA